MLIGAAAKLVSVFKMATSTPQISGDRRQRSLSTEGEENVEQAKTNKKPINTDEDHTEFGDSSADFVYDVEHLATFSTSSPQQAAENTRRTNKYLSERNSRTVDCVDEENVVATIATANGSSCSASEPRVALQRLFELEKLSGIWTQQMQIKLSGKQMLIVDCETSSIVERFHRDCVTKPEAFNQNNNIYNNIIVFVIDNNQLRGNKQEKFDSSSASGSHSDENYVDANEADDVFAENNNKISTAGEVHIFQCVSHQAQQLVADILAWKSGASPQAAQKQVSGVSNGKLTEQQDSKPPSNETTTPTTGGDTGGRQQVLSGRQTKHDTGDEDKIERKADGFEQQTTASAEKMSKQVVGDSTRPAPSAAAEQTAAAAAKPFLTVASSAAAIDNGKQIVNVNVKETVQIFNQIAALRETGYVVSLALNWLRRR